MFPILYLNAIIFSCSLFLFNLLSTLLSLLYETPFLFDYKQGNDSLNYSDNYLLDFMHSTFAYFEDICGVTCFHIIQYIYIEN